MMHWSCLTEGDTGFPYLSNLVCLSLPKSVGQKCVCHATVALVASVVCSCLLLKIKETVSIPDSSLMTQYASPSEKS